MAPAAGTAPTFSRQSSDEGAFHRQESAFRGWVSDDGSTEFPLEAGPYHLYVARACPWAHRTIIGRRLMGLEAAIGRSFVSPLRDTRGWAFTGGEYVDQVNGLEFLGEAYRATDPRYEARVTVPVLWDKRAGVIVNNESADVLRMLGTVLVP
jgi:glutathionyl-hydroquinone reductase